MFNRIFYDRKKSQIHLWETINGKRLHHTYEFEHDYYIEDPSGNSDFIDIFGKHVVPRKAPSKRYLNALTQQGIYCCEADLPEEFRFLHNRYEGMTLKADMSQFNVCFLDIEIEIESEFPWPDKAKYPINLITMYFSRTGHQYTLGNREYTGDSPMVKNYMFIPDEKRMMQRFVDIFRKERPDFHTGWNSHVFDIPYIINRCRKIDVDYTKMSPVGHVDANKHGEYLIGAVADLDYQQLYKKFTFDKKDSYTLQAIGQLEVGEGKIDYEGTLYDHYKKDWNNFVEYNVQDVMLVKKIDDEKKFLELVVNVCYESLIPFDRIFSTIAMHTGYAMSYLHNQKMVMSPRNNTRGTEVPGAFVFALSGFFKYLISFDVTSLYPFEIITYNIGPETLRLWPKDTTNLIRTPLSESDGIWYDGTKQSVLSQIVEEIFNTRVRFKNKMKICEQWEHGVGANEYATIADRVGISVEEADQLAADIEKEQGNAKFYNSQQHIRKIMINCFHPSTCIITVDGIKQISDVKVGDIVYSINKQTKMLEKKIVEHIYVYDFDGELETIHNNRFKIMVTPEHTMLATTRTGKVKEIKANDFCQRSINCIPNHLIVNQKTDEKAFCILPFIDKTKYQFEIIHTEHLSKLRKLLPSIHIAKLPKKNRSLLQEIDENIVKEIYEQGYKVICKPKRDYKCKSTEVMLSIDIFSKFIGFYLSEGHLYSSTKKTYNTTVRGITNSICISQCQNINPNTYAEIYDVCKYLSHNIQTTPERITISNDAISEMIAKNFGIKYDKHIFGGKLIEQLNKNIIFESMYKGDGVKKYNCYVIGCKYKQLFEDTMKLLVEIGRIPRFTIDKFSTISSYRISWNECDIYTQKTNYSRTHYVGKVHNITVADNHTVLVGSDGTFGWTGQSLYGACANEYFHFYNPHNAKCITQSGKHLIQYLSNTFNDYFKEYFWKNKKYFPVADEKNKLKRDVVVLIDTDSNYVCLEEVIEKLGLTFKTNEEFHAWALIFINDFFEPFIKQILEVYAEGFGTKQLIHFKREKIISQMMVVAKKHYATEVLDKEGTVYQIPKLEVTGIEIVKTSTPLFVRNKLKTFLKNIFTNNGNNSVKELMLEDLRTIRKEFEKAPIDQIAKPCGLTDYDKYGKSGEYYKQHGISYPKKCPPHHKAAINYNYLIVVKGLKLLPISNGTKMKFIAVKKNNKFGFDRIAFINKWPEEFSEWFEIDYNSQWESTAQTLVEGWFKVLKWGPVNLQKCKLSEIWKKKNK